MPAATRKTDSPLRARIAELRKVYGRPERSAVTDPFQHILCENVAYLANDARRAEAFAMLAEKVGLEPNGILAAPISLLREIGRKGILPGGSAEKLREIAEIAIAEFGGDLRPLAKLPLARAKRALERFPSIGEPSAEKLLLFARSHAFFRWTPTSCACSSAWATAERRRATPPPTARRGKPRRPSFRKTSTG